MPKRGSLSPQLEGPRQSVGVHPPNSRGVEVHHRNSRGRTKAWESITPTRGASNMEKKNVNQSSSIAPEG